MTLEDMQNFYNFTALMQKQIMEKEAKIKELEKQLAQMKEPMAE